MKTKPLVSVIIVNFNGKELLKIILESIKKSTFKNFEVLVVDNNSADGSQEFIKKNYKNVKLVENKENLGYSGINSALEYCKGKYILFLNNDMELDKNCIKNLVATIRSDKKVAMAAPKLINFYDKSMKSGGTWVSRAFYNGHIKGNNNLSVKEIPYLGVGLVKKELIADFGYLFDPDYFIYAEDLDLGLRIRLRGKKILFDPDATMYHMHSLTMKKMPHRSTFLLERNSLITFFKILSAKNILLFLPYLLLVRIAAIARDLLSLRLTNFAARLKAFLWVMLNFQSIMAKRKFTQKLRVADDNYILKVFSENYLFRKPVLI